MKRQLQGITLLLLAILFTIIYGDNAFFHLSFDWAQVFTLLGIVGAVLVFLPGKGE